VKTAKSYPRYIASYIARYIAVSLVLLTSLCLVACGYQPTARLTERSLGKRVAVEVLVSKTDPQNSVALKEAILQGVKTKLHKKVATTKPDSHIIARIKSSSFSATLYDTRGYITGYKAFVTVEYEVKFKNGSKSTIVTSGETDFSVGATRRSTSYSDSSLSDTERFEAIKNAASESFDDLISRLAVLGFQR